MSNYFYRNPQLSHEDQKILNAYLYSKPMMKEKPPKMKRTVNPNNTEDTFTKFGELPAEIQNMVWSIAAQDLPARTIELRIKEIKNPGPLEQVSQYVYKGMPYEIELPKYTHIFASPSPPPTLLSVSKHAREVTRGYYELAFRPILSELLEPPPPADGVGSTLQLYVANKFPDAACPNCTCCSHGIWVSFQKDIFCPNRSVFHNDIVQQNFFIAQFQHFDLYNAEVFPQSRLSLHKIQTLAMPIRSQFTRNTVIFSLGFLPGLKKILLIRTRGFDRKPFLKLAGRVVEEDTRPLEGEDLAVYAARTRGFRVLGNYLHVKEAQATAQMLYTRGRLKTQGEYPEEGPEGVNIWTATVKKEDGKMKGKVKKFLDTVSGRRFRNWMDKNYISPNFG